MVFDSHRVLVLGAGFTAAPALEYLLFDSGFQVTVASDDFSRLPYPLMTELRLVKRQADLSDPEILAALLAEHDLVISLLPPSFHPEMARYCICYRIPLITASYVSPEMQALHQEAVKAGVILLNEVGVDPGLDHMSLLRLSERLKQEGHQIDSLVSWCGGLPSPDSCDTPLGYKFSWSPEGVLKALKQSACFLRDGAIQELSSSEVLQSSVGIEIDGLPPLRGYPNRNSLRYASIYNLNSLSTLLRGTLRYPGFIRFFSLAMRLGLLDTKPLSEDTSWAELLASRSQHSDTPIEKWFYSVCEQLALQPGDIIAAGLSPFDFLVAKLKTQLVYGEGQADMVVMRHEIESRRDGEAYRSLSTLVVKGNQSQSAMAQTVGLPVAMAAEQLLRAPEECIDLLGVSRPTLPSIYEPILDRLAKRGIVFKEEFLKVMSRVLLTLDKRA